MSETPPRIVHLAMIKEFQCPGCIVGGPEPTECPKLSIRVGKYEPYEYFDCENNTPGVSNLFAISGLMYLGLPRGFNRVGPRWIRSKDSPGEMNGDHRIRLWEKGQHPTWDNFNIAVWAMEMNGYLFVRAYSPRINYTYVDIIEGGSRIELTPKAINVADFYGEFD